MRKSQRCTEVKLERAPMRMRTCKLARGHDDAHLDDHGRWQSTPAAPAEYGSNQEDK